MKTENQAQTNPNPPQNKAKSRFAIPKSLDSVIFQQEEKSQHEEEVEEGIPAYDESVNIDPALFAQAYDELVAQFRDEQRTSLVSILGKNKFSLDHNRFVVIVHNEVSKKQLERERDMILFLRQKTGVPNLIMEIEIREIEANALDKLPYTNEERLKIMEEKNPKLKAFMQRFSTQMKY
ncbi:MAG: hypothetical protein H6581_01320 [Bacteroidia bacterium]|nr:hypothetical protein [Bacteroidia bacterium]